MIHYAIRRPREDDDGDRDCVLVVRAYGLRGESRDYMPANQGGGKVSFAVNAAGQVYKQSSLCTWAGLSPQTETFVALNHATSSEGLGVMPKRLKSGSDHHRLKICGPSNGRHKIT